MDLLAPQSSSGTADGRRLTALTVRVFFVRRSKFFVVVVVVVIVSAIRYLLNLAIGAIAR